MTTQTATLPQLATADDMLGFISSAQLDYANSKTSAMKSAANAYLVYHHGESACAAPEMRLWLDQQIATRNGEIDKFNGDVDNDKRRAKKLAERTLNEEISDEEKSRLTALHTRTSSEWAKAKRVKIEGREGASAFTRIVKFVFGFDKPADASLVSRYAKVLEYIEQHKDELAGELTVDAIVALLNNAGGFEAALEKARNPEAANDDMVRTATLNKIKEAVDRAGSGTEIAFKTKHQQNGYVFLLGRPSANGVRVCGELAINDNEAEALLLKIDQDVIGSAEPTVEFMARTVSIAELVRDGRDSGITKDGTQAGEKYKVARTYSLTHFDGTQRMVVSARYAQASAVVHARPKASVHLGDVEPGQAALLNANASADITKLFGNAARRLLMSVNAVQGDAAVPVRWTVCTDLGGATSETEFDWTSMYAEAYCPVDKRQFEAKCTVNLKPAHIRAIYEEYLHDWGKAKKDDKNVNKPLTVSFNGETFTVGHEVYGFKSFSVGDKLGSPVSLQMRPRDIVDLFKKLIEFDVQQCVVQGDPDGLLAVSWCDDVGDYTVYMPTVEKRGGLSDKCLGQMKPKK